MRNAKDALRLVLLVSAVLLATFLFLRLLPAVRFLLMILLFGLLPLVLLYVAWQGVLRWRTQRAARAFALTPIGQLDQQQRTCQQQIDQLRAERVDIQQNIKELKTRLTQTEALPQDVQNRTEHLLRGFEQEDDLRLTKLQFYEKCLQKLTRIREQTEWLEQLASKQAQLEKYRDKHYDQLAEMEEMRWEVEKEHVQLETLQHLTSRMQNLHAVDQALHLQQELDKMLAQ